MGETGTVVQPLIKVKSVTLPRGHWIYVCPCGFQYSVSWVPRTTSKHALYCFYCKQQNGKYYKVMDERLEFTENWNGKLNCSTFTTMRLHNPQKYCVGAIKQIYLKGIWKGNAKVIDVKRIYLKDINLYVAKLDTGLPIDKCRDLFRNMY